MTITALSLTNPGFETGNTTGWTGRTGSFASFAAVTAAGSTLGKTPHSGTYQLYTRTNSASATFDQTVDLSAYAAAIDADTAAVKGSVYALFSSASGGCYLEFYAADGTTLTGDAEGASGSSANYAQLTCISRIPPDTRYVRIGGSLAKAGATAIAHWDDFALEISDSRSTDYPSQHFAPIATQMVAYALGGQTADEARATQIVPLTVSAAETSNGHFLVKTHQVVAYALVKGKVDRVDLRAWAFLQDDHLFYGLQLGSAGTIVYDILTQQWCQWYSPGYTYFRCEDVTDWEGYNLGADTENGTIWKIDPTGRLDEGTTAITSQCTGMVTVRMRENVPCFMAELAVSEANPSTDGTSIQLRTSDDATVSWLDHGTVDGEAVGTSTLFRWYGMGLMGSPGRVFEITNAGYCRRIDALMIEAGGRA